MKAVGYVRTSTDMQEASGSQQINEILIYCAKREIDMVEMYEDLGVSGTGSDRPGFQELMTACDEQGGYDLNGSVWPTTYIISTLGDYRKARDAENNQPREMRFEAVIIYDRSRWGRWLDHKDAIYWEMHLKHMGIELLAVEGTNEHGIGADIQRLMESFGASEYSENLSRVVRRGSRHNAERGNWNGGKAPFGYRRLEFDPAKPTSQRVLEDGERKANKEHRVRLVLGPHDEVLQVLQIFEHRESGKSLQEIAELLNQNELWEGWTKQQVGRILKNPVYKGEIAWNDRGGKYGADAVIAEKRGAHEAIIKGDQP